MAIKKDTYVKIGLVFGTAAVASLTTWVVANRRLVGMYEEKLQKEIQLSVQHIVHKLGVNVVVSDEDPDEVADELNDEAAEEPVEIEVELEQVDGERVFPSEDSKPPLEDLAARNQATRYDKISTPDIEDEQPVFPENPEAVEPDPDIFVISRDAFMANESDFDQIQLTFHSDGGVLNAQGDFIEDHETMIGPGTPAFGSESDDANCVYVRNNRLEKEFEILSDPGPASDFLIHGLSDMYKPEWAHGRKATG